MTDPRVIGPWAYRTGGQMVIGSHKFPGLSRMTHRGFRVLVPLAALLLAACASAPFPRGAPSSFLPPGDSTELDHAAASLALAPDESAYGLFRSGEDEFAARLVTIAQAGRSLDAQYYLWHDDLTGR